MTIPECAIFVDRKLLYRSVVMQASEPLIRLQSERISIAWRKRKTLHRRLASLQINHMSAKLSHLPVAAKDGNLKSRIDRWQQLSKTCTRTTTVRAPVRGTSPDCIERCFAQNAVQNAEVPHQVTDNGSSGYVFHFIVRVPTSIRYVTINFSRKRD